MKTFKPTKSEKIVITIRIEDYRVEQLEKKVEKHNQVVERVYKLEQADAVHNEEIKAANHRIEDLERKVS